MAGLLLALLSTGCLPSRFEPPTGPVSAASSEPVVREVSIDVQPDRILIAGKPVANDRSALQRALFEVTGDFPTLVVRSETEADSATLTNVIREVTHAPAQAIRLELGNFHTTLASYFRTTRQEPSLSGFVNGAQLELWARGANIATFTPGDGRSEAIAAALIQRRCPEKDCVSSLRLYDDTPLVATLRAWRNVTGDMPGNLIIDIDPDRKSTDSAGMAKTDAPKGRLPPETVQRIVREHFKTFLVCYDAGRSRNPKLIGDLFIVFVIERDGTVSHISNHGGNLPDGEVVDCILHEVSRMSFPQPNGGTLTVVYPLLLQPD